MSIQSETISPPSEKADEIVNVYYLLPYQYPKTEVLNIINATEKNGRPASIITPAKLYVTGPQHRVNTNDT